MLKGYDEVAALMSKFFMTNRMAALKITNKCPTECSHCRECSVHNSIDIMSVKVIDKVIEQIVSTGEPENWVVCLQGGEAILFPDLCEHTISECKKHRITTNLYTSGWWWRDKENYFQLIDKWQPDIFCLSVNDWTIAKLGVGLQYADEIAEHFADNDNPVVLVYSEVYLDRPKYFNRVKYRSASFPYQLAPCGRAKSIMGTYAAQGKKENWMPRDICVLSGFEIETDGTIYSNCCAASKGCKFGSIFDMSLADLYKLPNKPRCNSTLDGTTLFIEQTN